MPKELGRDYDMNGNHSGNDLIQIVKINNNYSLFIGIICVNYFEII
jgi:hypothetical protein